MKYKLLLGNAQQFQHTVEAEDMEGILNLVKGIAHVSTAEEVKSDEKGYPEGTVFLKLPSYPRQLVPLIPSE